ncbi:MAG: LCP family protein [Oscillospiraceae bacterium]|nr:LCP family protein [Oscillospiraceae bacterium]
MKFKETNTQTGNQAPVKKTKKAKKKGRVLLIVISILLVLAIGGGVATYSIINSLMPQVDDDTIEKLSKRNTSNLLSSKDVHNILVIGVDGRNSDGWGRADTQILVSIDNVNQRITMVSFLRDLYVEIPGRKGKNKINAAHRFGKVPLAVETIEQNFGVKIDNYIRVTFDAFEDAIDAMGGVTLPVTPKEAAEVKSYSKGKHDLVPGDNVFMDGGAALIFARIRKLDSDWQRTSRQRMVINALLEKAKANPVKAFNAVQGVMGNFETDISQGNILRLFAEARTILNYEVVEYMIPNSTTGAYTSVSYNLIPDLPVYRTALKNWLY